MVILESDSSALTAHRIAELSKPDDEERAQINQIVYAEGAQDKDDAQDEHRQFSHAAEALGRTCARAPSEVKPAPPHPQTSPSTSGCRADDFFSKSAGHACHLRTRQTRMQRISASVNMSALRMRFLQ